MWNATSGLCFVTFSEHSSSVSKVTFTSSGFVIVSASLDGTVRAFDLHRCVGRGWREEGRSLVEEGEEQEGEGGEEGAAVEPVSPSRSYRYRNFRTFTSPRPVQFSSLAVDGSGELVGAGAQDSFEIFLWSMQTGRLLEV